MSVVRGSSPWRLLFRLYILACLWYRLTPVQREKLNLIARAAYERTRPRHQETLRRLRLLATAI